MKLLLMASQSTWWLWLMTAVCLAASLAGHPAGFVAAIVLSLAQGGTRDRAAMAIEPMRA